MPIGIPELLIVLVIVLIVLGPKRLPGLGRSLGDGIRGFKESIRGRGERDALGGGTDERPADAGDAPERRS
jgi:sec-independent protein translocase protein TatA